MLLEQNLDQLYLEREIQEQAKAEEQQIKPLKFKTWYLNQILLAKFNHQMLARNLQLICHQSKKTDMLKENLGQTK